MAQRRVRGVRLTRVNTGIALIAVTLCTASIAAPGPRRSLRPSVSTGQKPVAPSSAAVQPASVDRDVQAAIEHATSSDVLEALLQQHPGLGLTIVPRIEQLAVEEVRREGPRGRFVVPGLEPDDGRPNSVTLSGASGGMSLQAEFPGDVRQVRFSDGSVHRFAGRVPFADVLTLLGDGDRDHRLTFVILDDIGMVYLRGQGRILILEDGTEKTVQLGLVR